MSQPTPGPQPPQRPTAEQPAPDEAAGTAVPPVLDADGTTGADARTGGASHTSSSDAQGDETAAPPTTGDPGVDRALRELEVALADDPSGQVEAVSQAHRALQARLTAPAPPPPPPGQARPGSR